MRGYYDSSASPSCSRGRCLEDKIRVKVRGVRVEPRQHAAVERDLPVYLKLNGTLWGGGHGGEEVSVNRKQQLHRSSAAEASPG